MIAIRCPQCHTAWKLDDSYAGTTGYCPRCRYVLDIPFATEAGAAAAEASAGARPEAPGKKIPIQCPQCRTTWNVDGAYAGIKGMCPACRHVLTVPPATDTTSAAGPAPSLPGTPPEVLPSRSAKQPARANEGDPGRAALEADSDDLVPLDSDDAIPVLEPADEPDHRVKTRPDHDPPPRRPREGDDRRPRRPRRKKRPPPPYRPRDEGPRSGGISIGFLESTFADTHFAFVLLFGFCCAGIALPLGIVGLLCTQGAEARRNALIMIIVASIMVFLAFSMTAIKSNVAGH